MRIAVVGGGISGSLAARLLSSLHDVTLFEAEARPGGHSRTIDVDAFGASYRIDTGFMVFNERTYPNFCRLLRLLGVGSQATDMSLSVRCERSGLEYQGSSLNGLFAQRRNLARPAFWRLLGDILRFQRDARKWLEAGTGDVTMGELLHTFQYQGWFVDKYLVPMSAAIWSCKAGELLDFPAHFLLGFLRNHGLLQVRDRPTWRTVEGGSRCYVDALLAPLRGNIALSTNVEAIWRQGDGVLLQARNRETERFDAVVFACHADRTLAILRDADPYESRVLAAFPYQANSAVVHTDTTLLPSRRRAWASWNYLVSADQMTPVGVTYDLSRLQHLNTPSPILLTLNSERDLDPNKVLDRYIFRHPVFTRDSIRAQSEHVRLNGRRRTYYCGAYWGYGFHEDGVNSALAVARSFGAGWEQWKAASTKEPCATSV